MAGGGTVTCAGVATGFGEDGLDVVAEGEGGWFRCGEGRGRD